jgi:hypothetical protein
MRTLGIVGMDQEITEVEMKAFVDVFAMPVSLPILTAIAALLGHTLLDELLRQTLLWSSRGSFPLVTNLFLWIIQNYVLSSGTCVA